MLTEKAFENMFPHSWRISVSLLTQNKFSFRTLQSHFPRKVCFDHFLVLLPVTRTLWNPSPFKMSLGVLVESSLQNARILIYCQKRFSNDVSINKLNSSTAINRPQSPVFQNKIPTNLFTKPGTFSGRLSLSFWNIVGNIAIRIGNLWF